MVSATSGPPPSPPVRRPSGGGPGFGRAWLGSVSLRDWAFAQLCRLCALFVILLAVLLCTVLVVQGWPAIDRLGLGFLFGRDWNTPADRYGALPFIYGTLMTSALAMVIAVPLGVGTAAFLAEIAPGWMRRSGSFLVELLAAIPSVVYGFWGINFLAPAVQTAFNAFGGPNVGGKGLFTAGLILSIMIVPYIAAVAFDVCQAVPRSQREGSLALGATRWQTIWNVVLPYARSGIIGGCFLGLGRAIGETMAVTMLIGNMPVIQPLPFGLGYTIPSVIASELLAPNSELHRATLIELGLILFGVTIVINILARLLLWRTGKVRGGWLPGGRRGAAVPDGRPPEPSQRSFQGGNNRKALVVNRAMTGVLGLALVLTLGPLFLILGYIAYRGFGALNWAFFVNLPKPAGEPGGGMANALVGSLTMVGLATLFACPAGILAAIFLAEYRRSRIGPVVRFVGELLNGVPSIIVGVFVYALVNLLIQQRIIAPHSRFSGWAGAFALAIMMIPIVMRTSEEALKLVPQTLRNASHALGAFHWQTVLRVTVPAALPAVITGVFLAIARIAGETAPLLMTAFGNTDWAEGPSDKTPSVPVYIYRYALSGFQDWENQAWAAALVLVTFVMALNVGIRVATGRRMVSAARVD